MSNRSDRRLLFLVFIALVAVLLLCAYTVNAHGQVYRMSYQCPCKDNVCFGPQQASGSVVKICHPRRTLFLTAGHCVVGAMQNSHRIHINGRQYSAKPLRWNYNELRDVAVMEVVEPISGNLPCYKIAPVGATIGEPVQVYGVSSGLETPLNAVIIPTPKTKQTNTSGNWISASTRVQPGDSGGAVVNRSGHLTGIISAVRVQRRLGRDIVLNESLHTSLAGIQWALTAAGIPDAIIGQPAQPAPAPQEPYNPPPATGNDNAEILAALQRLEARVAALENRNYPAIPDSSGDVKRNQTAIKQLQAELAALNGHVLTVELIDDKGNVTSSVKFRGGDTLQLLQNLKKEK